VEVEVLSDEIGIFDSTWPDASGPQDDKIFAAARWIDMMSELGYGSDTLDQIFLLGFVFGADGEGVEEPQA